MKDKGFVDGVGELLSFQVSEELLDAQADKAEGFSARIFAAIEERKKQ